MPYEDALLVWKGLATGLYGPLKDHIVAYHQISTLKTIEAYLSIPHKKNGNKRIKIPEFYEIFPNVAEAFGLENKKNVHPVVSLASFPNAPDIVKKLAEEIKNG